MWNRACGSWDLINHRNRTTKTTPKCCTLWYKVPLNCWKRKTKQSFTSLRFAQLTRNRGRASGLGPGLAVGIGPGCARSGLNGAHLHHQSIWAETAWAGIGPMGLDVGSVHFFYRFFFFFFFVKFLIFIFRNFASVFGWIFRKFSFPKLLFSVLHSFVSLFFHSFENNANSWLWWYYIFKIYGQCNPTVVQQEPLER